MVLVFASAWRFARAAQAAKHNDSCSGGPVAQGSGSTVTELFRPFGVLLIHAAVFSALAGCNATATGNRENLLRKGDSRPIRHYESFDRCEDRAEKAIYTVIARHRGPWRLPERAVMMKTS